MQKKNEKPNQLNLLQTSCQIANPLLTIGQMQSFSFSTHVYVFAIWLLDSNLCYVEATIVYTFYFCNLDLARFASLFIWFLNSIGRILMV